MTKPLRVLIVEDSEDDAQIVLRQLRGGGYDPQWERVDTPEAMRGALEREQWDVILCDYRMPRFDALAALKLLQEKQADIPFIIVSGTIGEDVAVAAMKAGAHDYIMKDRLSRLTVTVEREIREAVVRRERKRAEEALRESEKKYRDLFENANEAIFVAQDARLVFTNPTLTRMFGYSAEELSAKPFIEFIYPDDRDMVIDRHRRRLTGEELPSVYAFRVVRRDGSVRWVELSAVLIEWEGKPATLNFLIDITERKKAEDALRASEEKYRLLAENASDVIMLMDMTAKPVYFSPSVARLLGYSVEEALEGSMEGRMTPASMEKAAKHFLVGLDREKRDPGESPGQTLELEMIHKDGSIVVVEMLVSFVRDESGKPTGMMGIIRDITERKKAEAQIIELSNAFMATLDPVLILDMEGNVRNTNEAARRLFEREGLGVNALEAVAPEDKERVAAALQDLVKNGRPSVSQFNVVTRSGRRVPVEASGSIILDARGKPVGIVVVERDLTERKQAEGRQKLAAEILGILNEPMALPDAINRILIAIKRETGFYAVGIRLKKDEDFPYFVQNGFSEDFLLTENTLVVRDKHGDVCRDENGNVSLECTCGLVLSGKTDPSNPLFTPGGSAWTNDSIPLLDIPLDQDPRLHPRNRCIHAGFQSVALMPIRSNNKIVGLLQLNDRRKGCFTMEMIRFFEGIAASIGVALVRKQTEDALRESELKYRSLVEQSLLGILIVQDGRIAYQNSMMAEKSGYSLDELASFRPEQLKELIYPDDRDVVWNRMLSRLDGNIEPSRNECRFIVKGGSVYWADVHTSVIEYLGKPAVQLCIVDITERKQAEDALRESEEKYRGIFDESVAVVYLFDTNKRFVGTNQAGVDLLGYSREELLRMSIPDVDADPVVVLPAHQELLSGGRLINYEHRLRRKDGAIVTVLNNSRPLTDANGKIIGMLSTLIDITERKKAEEALRKNEGVLRSLLDATPAGVGLLINRVMQKVNNALCNITGYTREELEGSDVRMLYPNEEEYLMVGRDLYEMMNKEGLGSLEATLKHKSGKAVYVLLSLSPFDPGDRLAGVTATVLDITQRKRAEEALATERRRLSDIIKGTHVGTWEWNVQTGETIFNERWAEIVGYTLEELSPVNIETWNKLCHPDDLKRSGELLEKHFRGELDYYECEARMRHKDGSWVWVLDRGRVHAWTDDGKPLMMSGTHQDITERKKAEETLIRTNKAVEGSSDAIGLSDSQGHHCYHNKAFTELFEYIPEELEAAGGGPAVFANKHVARKVFDTIMGGGSWSGEVEMVSKSGRTFTVLERADAIKDESGKVIGLIGVHTDITERKKAEEKLRETRDYMENLIEHANVPMVVWTPDFRITRFNRAFERLTGMKAKSVIGKDLEILFPKGTRDRSMSFIRTAMRGARWEVVEIPIANVDGNVRIVLWNISPIYAKDGRTPIAIIAQGQDVTERKKAEEALKESEELSRSMLANAATGIYLLQEKKFIYVNPTFEKIIGYSSEELVGREAINFVHPDDREMVKNKAIEHIKGVSVLPYEFRALRKDGRQIWVMERVTPVRYKGRRAVLASFMETTEHKKAEVELERAYEELKTAHERMVQSEKLRAMGEMASGIAHDFNNMLAVILGRTQLVIDDVKDDKAKKGIQIIEQAALDAAKTVKRLQDFARIRVEHPFELLDVNEVAEVVLRMVEPRVIELEQTKGVAIKMEQEMGKVGQVSGDAAELREALLNILFNSMDAMPTGGRLTVKSEQDEDWVQISIKDTGVGIPDAVKKKVFEPFFSTKASKGSGLGLSVTYSIIARHGGMIKFDSAVGKGTTFYIRLPLAAEALKKEAGKRKTVAAKPANILIVDDEVEVLRALGLTLEYCGHWVKETTGGAEAIKAFKDGKYDIVITDLGMPEMSGWDVARAIKKIKPEVPVLLITGWVIDMDEEKKKLVDGVIAKPFSRESISSAISGVFPAKKKSVVKKKTAAKKKSTRQKKNE